MIKETTFKQRYSVLSAYAHVTGAWRSDGFTSALSAPIAKRTQKTSLDVELDLSILITMLIPITTPARPSVATVLFENKFN